MDTKPQTISNRRPLKAAIAESTLNLIMAILFVVPMAVSIYKKIPFTFEMNDDAALNQVLDGSYLGVPDGHSIFVRYPLSGIIAKLYEHGTELNFFGIHETSPNWYVATIVIVSTIAMVAVLFRILCYVGRFRIALCILWDLVFLFAWLPHFTNMTFSTAAGFMACMGILYFGFLRADEAWRPWNIATMAFIMVCAYSLREQCFLMVLPFIGVEAVLKFGIRFFKSIKPWVCVGLTAALIFAGIQYDKNMYSSDEWQEYMKYNSMRSHMQDYVGYPDYEENREFYDSIGMSENDVYAMKHYTYCMVEGYSQENIRKVYEFVHAKEESIPLMDQMRAAVPKAKEYFAGTDDCTPWLVEGARYAWILALALLPLSILFYIRDIRRRVWSHLANLLAIGSSIAMTCVLWVYLAIDARFPDRVEEVIRLLTLCAGVYVAIRIMGQWNPSLVLKEPAAPRGHHDKAPDKLESRGLNRRKLAEFGVLGIIQIAMLFAVVNSAVIPAQFDAVIAKQDKVATAKSEKYDVIRYCGDHPDNLYVLDTTSVTGGTRPGDDLHQGNWFMSGSWMNLSPVYYQKLAAHDTDTLSRSFLSRDNVYYITKGEKNVAKRMGYEDKSEVDVSIADRFDSGLGHEFIVYKVE